MTLILPQPTDTTISKSHSKLHRVFATDDGASDQTVVANANNSITVNSTVLANSFVGNLTGNATTVTNGVYRNTNNTFTGTNTFTGSVVVSDATANTVLANSFVGNLTGNASTVTNGVYRNTNNTLTNLLTAEAGVSVNINPLDADVSSEEYPDGWSAMRISNLQTGYPNPYGLALTYIGYRGGTHRGVQFFIDKIGDGFWYRTRNDDDTAWEDFMQIGTTANIESRDAIAGSSGYPDGMSTMRVFSDQSGWPTPSGSVMTYALDRGSAMRITQFFIDKIGDGFWYRTRNDDDTAWEDFTQIATTGMFPSSLGTNGWKKFPDPNSPSGYFIMQWMLATESTSSSNWKTLPMTFPNVILGGHVTPAQETDSGGGAIVSKNTSQIVFKCGDNYNNGTVGFVTVWGY